MSFTNKEGKLIVLNIIDTIQKHKDYLSEIDGAIGDGDHGINMNKGVTIAKSQVEKNETLSEALCTLSCVLMEKIGGSMGPLYGSIFMGMQAALGNAEYINGAIIEKMLKQAYDNIQMISPAKPGDKTLVDVLAPAVQRMHQSLKKHRIHALLLQPAHRLQKRGCRRPVICRLN